MLNLFIFEITLLVLCAVLIAVLLAIMWWRIAGDRVKALIAGWLALPLLWKIVLPVVFGAFVLHGSVKRGEVVESSCSGRKEGENSILQLNTTTTTKTPSFLQSSTVSLGLFRTTGFEVDSANKILEFSVAWDDDLFDYTLSRNIFLYVSTNLVLKRWSLFDVYPMPEGTNAHTFAVSLSNYNWASSAFFQFGLDIDSDNDNLKDSYERLCTLTDPADPDSDGDGISDGQEIALGLDPLAPIDPFLDLDGDGLTHKQELEFGSNPLMADSDGDGLDDATELRNGWDPNWPGETNEANAPGGAFTTFDRPFTANVRFENPYQEATVYGVSEGSHTVVLSDMVTRDAHKDIASTVTNNIITVTTLNPKPIFTTNVTGVLIVKLKCDDYGAIKIGDLAVTNSWPNTEYVKAWKVIEANTTNEVDVVWDSKGGSKWNFEYECYFYPGKPQVRLSVDVPEGVALGGERKKAMFSFVSDSETNCIVTVRCVKGLDKVSLWSDFTNGVRLAYVNTWDISRTNSFSCFVQGESLSAFQEVQFECSYLTASGLSGSVLGKTTVFACYTQPIENSVRIGCEVVNPSFLSPQSNVVFRVDVDPIDIPPSNICWRIVAGDAVFLSGTNGTQSIVSGVSGTIDIEVSVLGVSEENMHLKSMVVQ